MKRTICFCASQQAQMTECLVYPAFDCLLSNPGSIFTPHNIAHSHAEHASAHTQSPTHTRTRTRTHTVYGPEISDIQVLPLLPLLVNC